MRKIKICVSCINGYLTYDFIQSLRNQNDFKSFLIGIDMIERNKGKFYAINFIGLTIQKMRKNIFMT